MQLKLNQIFNLLAAIQDVATAQGTRIISDIQIKSIKAIYRYVFTHEDDLDIKQLPKMSAKEFPQAFPNKVEAEYALRFLVITALMDGKIDEAQINAVFAYAAAAHIDAHYLLQLKKTLAGDLPWIIKDIMQKNLQSLDIFPDLKDDKDIDAWIFPYRGNNQDPALKKKYEALGKLSKDSFGYHIWLQFKENNYKFPGEEEGVNYSFIMPHDSVHILSGYDTSPYGELLVSVFTSTMVSKYALEGHIIPVMYSFYLGIKINDLAGTARITIDPKSFWNAWYRGSQMQVNLFAEGWSLWPIAEIPLEQLKQLYHILPIAI